MSDEAVLHIAGIIETLPEGHPDIPGLIRAAKALRDPAFRGEAVPSAGPAEVATEVASQAVTFALAQIERARRILSGEQFALDYKPLGGRRDVLAQNAFASLPDLPTEVYQALREAHECCDLARTARFEAAAADPE